MARDVTEDAGAAFAAGNVRLVALVALDFASGTRFVNSTNMRIPFDWDGNGAEDFLGIGHLGGIGAVQENGQVAAQSLEMTLSGVAPENVSSALGEAYQGRFAKLWFAALDIAYDVIADPVLVWDALMDTMPIQLGAEGKISVVTVSHLARWEDGLNRRLNNATQQEAYPGDLGLEFVEAMVEKTIIWPK